MCVCFFFVLFLLGISLITNQSDHIGSSKLCELSFHKEKNYSYLICSEIYVFDQNLYLKRMINFRILSFNLFLERRNSFHVLFTLTFVTFRLL